MEVKYFGALSALACFYLYRGVDGVSPIVTQVSTPRILGEGPVWDEVYQVLYYCDIEGKALHRFNPKSNTEQVIYFDQKISIVVPVKGQKYQFVVALGRDLTLLTWNFNSNKPYSLLTLLTVEQHSPDSRFNDGIADAKGRIYAGTKGPEDENNNSPIGEGTLYRVDLTHPSNLSVIPLISNATISNGLVFSLDDTMLYYIDSPTRVVDALDFDLERGTVSNRRIIFRFDDYNITGIPDGMTIDCDGNLWVACIGPGLVIKIEPRTGKLLQSVRLPVPDVTSVSFGGEDMSTLFVTTKRPVGGSTGGHRSQDGALFRVDGLGVRGPYIDRAVIRNFKTLFKAVNQKFVVGS